MSQYVGAYDEALTRYKDVLSAQFQADQANRELAFTALALAGGNGLVAVFAKCLRTKMGDAALNFVAKHNLERGFMVLYHGHSNPVAKFALDNAWSIATNSATDALKQRWVTGAQMQVSGLQGPFSLTAEMTGFYYRVYEGLSAWLCGVCESAEITDAVKVEIVRSVGKAPFVAGAPRASALPPRLSARLLLGFYMKFLLDQDFVEVCKPEMLKFGAQAYAAACSSLPITAFPSQKTAGRASAYPTGGVHYKPLGARIREGVDSVHQELFGLPFFASQTSFAALVEGGLGRQLTFDLLAKAERTLSLLSIPS